MTNTRFILILLICVGAAFSGALYVLGGFGGLSQGSLLAQAAVLLNAQSADAAQVESHPLAIQAERERAKLRQNLANAHAAFHADPCNEKAQAGFIAAIQAYFERYNNEVPTGRIADLTGKTGLARSFWLTQDDLKIREIIDAAAAENLIVSGDFSVPLDDIMLGRFRISPPMCRV